jgi:6-phosphogluconolactonase
MIKCDRCQLFRWKHQCFKRYADGKLSDVFQNIKFEGVGVNPKRQEKSHIHQVQFSPDGRYVLLTDLGLDKIYVFKYNKTGDQPLEKVSEYDAKKGSGPRHIAFNKSGIYSILFRN